MFGNLLGSMPLSGALGNSISQILNGGGQKERFIAILLATADHVGKKKNFNLELEINDLNIRLGNLSRTSGGGGLIGAINQQLTDMSSGLNSAALSILRNIR